MRFSLQIFAFVLLVTGFTCNSNAQQAVFSPDGSISLSVSEWSGRIYYSVSKNSEVILAPSLMGVELDKNRSLTENLTISGRKVSSFNDTWDQVWGEVKTIRNEYNQLELQVKAGKENPLNYSIVFRVFDDGVGFRYVFPEQTGLTAFNIMDERTEFAFTDNHSAWWINGLFEGRYLRYEYLYKNTLISQMDVVHTPVTFETVSGYAVSIHEANLTDYASMLLEQKGYYTFKAHLVPWMDGTRVKAKTPFQSPWRTIQIGENAGDLVTSTLILNLNEPNKITDVSWVKPGKYVGIWWGMHIGPWSFGSGPNHGATTARTIQYIDFAAKHGFEGVLVEGWNTGWDGTWWDDKPKTFNFTEPHPDYDLKKVTDYARKKGVTIIGHNETGADMANFEKQIDAAFKLYEELGIKAIKTGYVGPKPNGEWPHGQFAVRHYQLVTEKAAKHKILVDIHEPIKDTGIRRTWPNMMTREGARGQEYNAWSGDGGNPPEHETILPFTRMLSGPMDFTPGIFDLHYKNSSNRNRVNTTLAKQLAIYVTYYSPWHMAADLIENYENQPAFQFIKDVPTNWSETRVLNAKIGEYFTVVRKDWGGEDWYLGSVTDEKSRSFEFRLDFLDGKKSWVAEQYADGPGADWAHNAYPVSIQRFLVDATTILRVNLAAGGGQAIRFRPALETDMKSLKPYMYSHSLEDHSGYTLPVAPDAKWTK